MIRLTPSDRKCLDAIRALTVKGVAPTYRELADHMGVASTSSVHRQVVSLEARGCVRRTPYRFRAIEIVPHLKATHAAELRALPILELRDLITTAMEIYADRTSRGEA